MTQYMLSVIHDWNAPPPPEEEMATIFADVDAFNQKVMAEGKTWVFAGGLCPPSSATVVDNTKGTPTTTDGPYVETKEHLGGFTVVDVPDDEAARYWAGRLAVSLDWPQEVHRFPSGVVEIIERRPQESG